jgi:hypothetical protein
MQIHSKYNTQGTKTTITNAQQQSQQINTSNTNMTGSIPAAQVQLGDDNLNTQHIRRNIYTLINGFVSRLPIIHTRIQQKALIVNIEAK